MINKKSQKTKLDDLLKEDKDRSEKLQQLELVRQDQPSNYSYRAKEPWISNLPLFNFDRSKYLEDKRKEKENRPIINLNYPELNQENIKYRKLNENEIDELLQDEKYELNRRKQNYLDSSPIHKEPPETQQYFDINKQLPEEIKKDILESYNSFREVAAKFKTAYEDANLLASTDLSFNYTGTFIEIVKRFPEYIERSIKYGIGTLFGLSTTRTARRFDRESNVSAQIIIDFLKRGVNLFNITPLNYQSKKKELANISTNMNLIIQDYEKRKKVLIKLPKIINSSMSHFLRKKENKEFLKWCEEYFPTEKENFIKESVQSILTGETDQWHFSISSLTKMKTYQDIYYKASRTAEFSLREKMESRIRATLVYRVKLEIQEYLNPKLENLKNIFPTILENNDISQLEKFLFSNFNFDLRGILQFCDLSIRNIYPDDYEDRLKSFKTEIISNLNVIIYENYDYKIFSELVIDFINQYSPSGGRANIEKINKIPLEEIKNLSELLIKKIMVEKILPNFNNKDSKNKHNYNYPNFSGPGNIIEKIGKFNTNEIVNFILKKAPFIPKEFITLLVKQTFKDTIKQVGQKEIIENYHPNDILRILSNIDNDISLNACKVLLHLLKKSNKWSSDNFNNYFRKLFSDLNQVISFFEYNFKPKNEIKNDELIQIFLLAFKGIDTVERDRSQFETFIKYLHDSAGNLSVKDLLSILQNNNYQNYSKIGISKKILNSYSLIKNLGGISGIKNKYNTIILEMQESGFVSKNFEKNIRFVVSFFNSGKEINPSHPQFQKIFDTISTIETDIQTIEMGDATKELLQNYQKKDSRLFLLDFELAPNLRFRVLKDKDPRILRIGIETNCCQRIGGVGEEAAKQSFINPMASIVILEWQDEGEWKILTQSYFHYVPKENGYILDNVEWNAKNCRDSMVNLEASYALLAQKMKNDNNIEYFLAGKGYSKISTNKFSTYKIRGGDPRFFSEGAGKYSDFSPSNSIDLLNPKFKLDKANINFKSSQLNNLLNNFIKLTT